MQTSLEAMAAGEVSGATLELSYQGLSMFHGNGEAFVLSKGTLVGAQQRGRDTVNWRKELLPKTLAKLAKLLLRERAWEQQEPERLAVPDETRATLSLSIGAGSAAIWEWYGGRRTKAVRDFLLEAAPPP
jgi:hypothetical protein